MHSKQICSTPVAPIQGPKVHCYIAKGLQLSQKENIVAHWHKGHLVENSIGCTTHNNS